MCCNGMHGTSQICFQRTPEVFDTATFNRVNICTNQNETLMKQIQNSQKSVGKSMPSLWILKILRKKICDTLSNLCDFQTKIHLCTVIAYYRSRTLSLLKMKAEVSAKRWIKIWF